MKINSQINNSTTWNTLKIHQKEISQLDMITMFQEDKQRFQKLSLSAGQLFMDYSKQRIVKATLEQLAALASHAKLANKIKSLFNGDIINLTEQRPALHTKLREPKPLPMIANVLSKMEKLVITINKQYTDVISIGIGGSYLGPMMVCRALQNYQISDLKIHFIANVDPTTIKNLMMQLDPKSTICIVNSKTFTTIETLSNANIIKNWFMDKLNAKNTSKRFIAVTANTKKALEFGIAPEHILQFWDWVGGRYSVWSSVGFPIALLLGMQQFKQFLAGAHQMDLHFQEKPIINNMPIIMALLGIWNINFWNSSSLAIVPYLDAMANFPEYLQQLEMESNGKSIDSNGNKVSYQTAPVIWGGIGCNAQHAYMQLLHQGTQIIPVDFLIAAKTSDTCNEQHKLLISSCIAQSRALMLGRTVASHPEKNCPGNRPSTTIIFDQLCPTTLGNLIALYEHKVFVQGIIWNIQSFDQWGVELGKELVVEIASNLNDSNITTNFSKENIIKYINS